MVLNKSTMLQWIAPHPFVYGQHKLESVDHKRRVWGGGGREREVEDWREAGHHEQGGRERERGREWGRRLM